MSKLHHKIGYELIDETTVGSFFHAVNHLRRSYFTAFLHSDLSRDVISMEQTQKFIHHLFSNVSFNNGPVLFVFHHAADHVDWKETMKVFTDHSIEYLEQLMSLSNRTDGQQFDVVSFLDQNQKASQTTQDTINHYLSSEVEFDTVLSRKLSQLVPFTILPRLNQQLINHYGLEVEKRYFNTNTQYLKLLEDYVELSKHMSNEELSKDESLLQLVRAIKDEMMAQIKQDVEVTIESQSDVLNAYYAKYPELDGGKE